jgi:lambda family phage portal protein
MTANAGIILGPSGETLSSPQTRRHSSQQRIKARFDAAQTTIENSRHWASADFLGPNSELDPGTRRLLRSRARYECANNSYASGMIRSLANDTIGTGPDVQITDRRISRDDATAIENAFCDWCLAIRLPEKLRLMRQAKARDGESFAQIFENPRVRNPVRWDFNPFEADMVATTMFTTTLSNILDGLFVDDYGNVISYNVLRQHPGEHYQSLLLKADVIPARKMIHFFHADRPGQYRGCPEITPSLPLFAQLRRYTLAVIRAAESAALPSWLLETQQPPSEMEFGDPFDVLDTERGMGVTLPAGYKMSQLRAEQPTSTYPQFKREILTEIARCLSIPYNIAAGDSSSYNYSSGRLDNRNWYKTRRVERANIESNALDILFEDYWWPAAILVPGLLPKTVQSIDDPAHEWRWDGDEHVDPTKEADAAVTRMSNGLSSITDEVGRLGGDAEVVHRKNAEALGLSFEEYRKRLADKLFGAIVASSSQDVPEPAASPYQTGGANAN